MSWGGCFGIQRNQRVCVSVRERERERERGREEMRGGAHRALVAGRVWGVVQGVGGLGCRVWQVGWGVQRV